MQHYIGLPYLLNGETREGVDCYGLIKLYYQEVLGVALPSRVNHDLKQRQAIAENYRAELHELTFKVSSPKEHDLVLLRVENVPMHIGLIIRQNTMLHILNGGTSCIERLDRPRWKSRIQGYYRLK